MTDEAVSPSPKSAGEVDLSLKSTPELLSEKLSREQADALYQPLGAGGNYTRTLLHTNDEYGNNDDIELTESWHNFDQLMVLGGKGAFISTSCIDVISTLAGLEYDTTIYLVVWSGRAEGFYEVVPSDDGMTWAFQSRDSSAVHILRIYGIKYS